MWVKIRSVPFFPYIDFLPFHKAGLHISQVALNCPNNVCPLIIRIKFGHRYLQNRNSNESQTCHWLSHWRNTHTTRYMPFYLKCLGCKMLIVKVDARKAACRFRALNPNFLRLIQQKSLRLWAIVYTSPLKHCVVTWAGLDPSNNWVYVLNRHFRTKFSICSSLGTRGTSVPIESWNIFISIFGVKVPANPTVFELQAKACRNVLDTDDHDADWSLRGAKTEPTFWRGRDSLKARSEST